MDFPKLKVMALHEEKQALLASTAICSFFINYKIGVDLNDKFQ